MKSPDDPDLEQLRIARTLRWVRQRAGLSLRELARRAATSHSALSAYERGRKAPTAATLLRILDAAGYTAELRPHRRIRRRDGIERGEELAQVLTLAEQFPVRAERTMSYPRFGARDHADP